MAESRIDRALARIEAALSRMDTAHQSALASAADKDSEGNAQGSARVMELVNTHEKLREEVADTLRDLDSLIGELEG
ncbi:MAG: hypothetical protein AAF251_03525 [Pseudomonadota bacterium]